MHYRQRVTTYKSLMIPTPKEIGLPAKFKVWRPNQYQSIIDGHECSTRFCLQVQRPGAGKTASYMSQGLLAPNKRFMFLTVLKGLQDQLIDDFNEIGLADIKGKGTYDCAALAGHKCDTGSISKCMYKGTSLCNYTYARTAVSESRLGTSNYSCWIAANKYGEGFGKYDVLVCDEAHNLPQQLAKAAQVALSEREIRESLDSDWPDHRSLRDMEAWKQWALVRRTMAALKMEKLKIELDQIRKPSKAQSQKFKEMQNLVRRLAEIATCKADKWVADESMYGYVFDPIEPAALAEKLVWRGIEKIIVTSGTVRPKTLTQLNIEDGDFTYYDYPSEADPSRTPLIYIPTAKCGYKSQDYEKRRIVARADEIIEGRLDRKGIIHTSSNKMRDLIMERSKFGPNGSNILISNYTNNGDITSDVINRYKRADAPSVLVSASVVTGYDFPFDQCRYQIVAKLNFPSSNTRVEKERDKLDPERSSYHAWQSLEQAFGRGDRDNTDWQEVFVIDDAMKGLLFYNRELASPHLLACYRQSQDVPTPPSMEQR